MKFNTVHIENWFSTDIPEKWEFEIEDDLITFYNAVNPKGVLQVSCYTIEEFVAKKDEFVMQHLNNVIKQFEIIIDTFTKKIIESPYLYLCFINWYNC